MSRSQNLKLLMLEKVERADFSIFYIIFLIFLITLFFGGAVVAEPFGANVSVGAPSRAPNDTPTGVAAYAGNVTQVNVFGYSITQSWQGYFGNVTGVITLSDGSDNAMYNWSVASPRGEIFASTNNSINWNRVQCLNYTANGSMSSIGEIAGNVNLAGVNLSRLETMFNISSEDVDGVNETFAFTGGAGHDRFYVNNLEFNSGECVNARIFDGTGQGSDGNFEEVLLYEPVSTSIIFTSILERDLTGFDQATHDFEMLVLENGHGLDTQATTYYFYLELE